tara:strand:- start:254 stop:502 length:249 start_codon:yes stop_codon:yes gene_type:complete
MDEYVEDKNDPVLILLANNKGCKETKNADEDKTIDLMIYFAFNLNDTKYTDIGMTKNSRFPGRIDKENPHNKLIKMISRKGI